MRHAACAVLLAGAMLGCAKPARLPDAELLVISADSTFWVTSTGGTIRVRGVPMLVARVDGTFRELYVADDDRSYADAVFVGHRLFSRDLERGDSLELHRDTVVQSLARTYERRHPDEAPLEPDDPENDDASVRATGDIEILALHGPYLSFEHHTDVDTRGDELPDAHQHSYRRGVLDIRTGRVVALSELFAHLSTDSAISAGRDEWRRARDSLLVAPGIAVRRVRGALDAFAFDAGSFTLGSAGFAPTVRFAVPARGTNPDIEPIELSSRRMPVPAWWGAAALELPQESGDQAVWGRRADTLIVSANHDTRLWELRLRVGAAGARAVARPVARLVARFSSPVDRVIWLDSTVPPSARAALTRAFAEASEYDGAGQVAAGRLNGAAGTFTAEGFAALRDRIDFQHHAKAVASTAAHPTRRSHGPGVAARVVGPDDAAGREHARSRLRRRDPGDAGQDRGRVRHAPRAVAVRHGIG